MSCNVRHQGPCFKGQGSSRATSRPPGKEKLELTVGVGYASYAVEDRSVDGTTLTKINQYSEQSPDTRQGDTAAGAAVQSPVRLQNL
jgi:hypothetical protein